jgi:PAS domain S-box-containing protein
MNNNQKQRLVDYRFSFLARFFFLLTIYALSLGVSLFFVVHNTAVYYTLLAVIVMITVSIAYFFTSRIFWPIRTLVEAMNRFSTGYPLSKVEQGPRGEIGALIESFNLMEGRLNRSYVEMGEKIKDQTRELDLKLSEIEGKNKVLQDTQTALLNVLEDIDKEKNNSENLATDLQKFRLAVDNASDHIIITDPDAEVLYANHAAELITGYSAEEMSGKTPALWGGLMSDEFYQKMWNTIKDKKVPFIGESQNRHKNGETYIAELKISPILDDSGNIKFYVGIERDITKAKEIDRAKTEFVSLASHQLRTPLSIINWYAEMLLEGDVGKITVKEKSYVDEIYRTNRRMIDLVNALLDISKIDLGTFPIELDRVKVSEISDDIIIELNLQIKEKNIVVTKKYAAMPDMEADPKIIRIILQNLLSNAVKYSKDSGRINVFLEQQEANLAIKIEDSGIGIPSGQQDKIFTKLFRADNAREIDPNGNGLGLYLTKSLIDELGGRIWFKSVEDQGTTFFVTMPFKKAEETNGQKSASGQLTQVK